jgi:hypothetical protein
VRLPAEKERLGGAGGYAKAAASWRNPQLAAHIRKKGRRIACVAAEPPRAGLAGGVEVATDQGGVDEVADADGQGDDRDGGGGPRLGFMHDGGD